MIKVIFFAALREQLGCNDIELNASDVQTVLQVKELLGKQSDDWQKTLNNNALLCAVNHQMVNDQQTVNAGDEVAFFPPVTGG